MNFQKIFSALMLISAVAFSACRTIPGEDPDTPGKPDDTTSVVDPVEDVIDWSDVTLPDGAITVAEARKIAAALENEASTSETYYVYGVVKKFGSKHESGMTDYGNATFYMVDKTGDSDDFEAYQIYNLNKQKFTSLDQIAVGDRVVVCCHITNYNGTYETVGKGDAYLYWTSNANAGSTTPSEKPEGLTGDGSEANPFTVADVITMNNTVAGTYFVKGILVGQVAGGSTSLTESTAEFAAPFTPNGDTGSNTNILIAAEATNNSLSTVVAVQLPAGYLRDALNLIEHADNLGKEVIIYGSLEKYFGTVGIKSMTRAFIDGQEIVLEIGNEPTATVATIAEFNAAPVNSTTEGVYYELTGTISNITNTTYGNFDLTDATGTVYVYGLTASYLPLSSATKANNDKSYSTLGLQDGDNITIRGVRAAYGDKIEVLGAYFVKKN